MVWVQAAETFAAAVLWKMALSPGATPKSSGEPLSTSKGIRCRQCGMVLQLDEIDDHVCAPVSRGSEATDMLEDLVESHAQTASSALLAAEAATAEAGASKGKTGGSRSQRRRAGLKRARGGDDAAADAGEGGDADPEDAHAAAARPSKPKGGQAKANMARAKAAAAGSSKASKLRR